MGYYCNNCEKPISKKVYDYSMKVNKKPLCISCQKDYEPLFSDKAEYKSYTPKPQINSKVTPQAKALYDALQERGIKCKLEAYDGYKHVDISIEWAKLNIEIDGKHHLFKYKQMSSDMGRDTGSQEEGIYTMRIPNSSIEEDVNKIADNIAKLARKKYHEDEF